MDILNEIDLDPTEDIRSAQSDDAQRRSALMRKVRSTYAKSTRDADLAENLEDLLDDMSEKTDHLDEQARAARLEANILVVVGESGAGKTTALNRLFSRHALFPGYGEKGSQCRLVTIMTPSPCSLTELGRATLQALGYRLKRVRVYGPEIWRIVREQVREQNILLLHFDELQHALQKVSEDEQQQLRNNLKSLLVDVEHPIGLVLSGTAALQAFLQPDRQVQRRGTWMEFAPLVAGADDKLVRAFVSNLAKTAELRFDKVAQPDLVPRLLHAGRYQLGTVAEEIHNAIRRSLKRGKGVLLKEDFATAFARRTGNLAPWNPYVADDYLAVDVTRMLARTPPPPPEPEHKPRGRRGRK